MHSPDLSYFTIIRMGVSLLIQISSFLEHGRCTETFALVSVWVFFFLLSCFIVLFCKNINLALSYFELGEGGHVICYEMDDIKRKLGFGRNSLVIFIFASII